ncbi:RHS repeat-associated core domain-containing protein, partial [Novipirellula rosea]|uniref:RHS repeat-associated core domain-containing protein n=1 Tax=Novipirellula rosea TaxID=1031540 RepID=UPI0031ED8F9D
GEAWDSTLNRGYNRARWYDASAAQWNRLDPFSGNMQDPQSLHKYAYVHGDPIQGLDPSGLFTTGEMSAAIAVAVGVVGIGALIYGNYLEAEKNKNKRTAFIDALKARQSQDMKTLERDREKAIMHLDSAISKLENGNHQNRFYAYFRNASPSEVKTRLEGIRDSLDSITFMNRRAVTWDYAHPEFGETDEQKRDLAVILARGGNVAGVFPNDGKIKIYVNETKYFRLSGDGAGRTRAETLIHEMSHELYKTDDLALQRTPSGFESAPSRRQLIDWAAANPDDTLNSAYTYGYFVVWGWQEATSVISGPWQPPTD